MGQKVSPTALRVGINKKWRSRWVPTDKKVLALWLREDAIIRKTIESKLMRFISKIEIERQDNKLKIFLWSSRLGLILGQKSKNIERIVFMLKKALKRRNYHIEVEVKEVKNSGLNAQLVANELAHRIANRENYRNLQRQAVKNAIRLGAKGIKITVAGRLNGADIARKEHIHEGKIPLSTLRADIDYGFCESLTTYGQIGVKVWIFKGNILKTEI